MGFFDKLFGENTVKVKQPDENAVDLANRFLQSFYKREGIEELDRLSEQMIGLASIYAARRDAESYRCLLKAAEETSYLYHGNDYPNELVEDLMRAKFNAAYR